MVITRGELDYKANLLGMQLVEFVENLGLFVVGKEFVRGMIAGFVYDNEGRGNQKVYFYRKIGEDSYKLEMEFSTDRIGLHWKLGESVILINKCGFMLIRDNEKVSGRERRIVIENWLNKDKMREVDNFSRVIAVRRTNGYLINVSRSNSRLYSMDLLWVNDGKAYYDIDKYVIDDDKRIYYNFGDDIIDKVSFNEKGELMEVRSDGKYGEKLEYVGVDTSNDAMEIYNNGVIEYEFIRASDWSLFDYENADFDLV